MKQNGQGPLFYFSSKTQYFILSNKYKFSEETAN